MNDARMWSVPELATAAGCSDQTVRLDITRGVIPARKVAGRFVIPDATAQHYVTYRQQIQNAQAVVDRVRAGTQERKDRRDRNRTGSDGD